MPLIYRRTYLALSGAVATAVGLTDSSVATSTEHWPMFGYDETNVAALPARSGPKKLDEIWSFDTRFEIDSSPVVADGMVYIGSDDRHLYALDTDTGEMEWSFETEDEVSQSTPAVSNGVVFFHAMSEALYAFDAKTGDELWSADSKWSGSSVTVKGETVYYGHHYTLFARDAETGDKQWEFSADGRITGAPAVVDGTVYFGTSTGNTLHAVNTETGEEKWQFEPFGSVYSSPAVADGTVFVGSDDSHLYALDVESGSERWRFETEGTNVRSSPAVANGNVYFLGSRQLYAVTISDGTAEWTFDELHALNSSPAIVDDVLYVGGGADGIVYALQADTGRQIATHETNDTIWNSSPAIASEKVFIGSHDHSVYALGNEQTFLVQDFESPEEVEEGDEVAITAIIENTGIRDGKQDIVFEVGNSQEDVESGVTLGSGETFDATFTYETDRDDPPAVTVTVATDDDEASAEVTVIADEDEEKKESEKRDEEDEENEPEDDDDTEPDTPADGEPDAPDDDEVSDEDAPGFGVGNALASLGSAAYLLKRRLIDDERED